MAKAEATNAWVLLKDPRNFNKVNKALKEAGFTDLIYNNGYIEFQYRIPVYDQEKIYTGLRNIIPFIYSGLIEFSDAHNKWEFVFEFTRTEDNIGSGAWLEKTSTSFVSRRIEPDKKEIVA